MKPEDLASFRFSSGSPVYFLIKSRNFADVHVFFWIPFVFPYKIWYSGRILISSLGFPLCFLINHADFTEFHILVRIPVVFPLYDLEVLQNPKVSLMNPLYFLIKSESPSDPHTFFRISFIFPYKIWESSWLSYFLQGFLCNFRLKWKSSRF